MIELIQENYIFAFVLTLFAGLSTSFGATIIFLKNSKSDNFLSFGLAFSAGIMIYVSFMEIIPKSIESFYFIYLNDNQSKLFALAFFAIGIAISIFINKFLLKNDNLQNIDDSSGNSLVGCNTCNGVIIKQRLKRTGIFTAIAIAIHNFPEGFATFISAINDPTLGLSIAFAIALHNIPEGMAVSMPIYHSTGSKKKAFLYASLSGLAEPFGAIIGFLILLPLMGDATLGITFAIVAGIMMYISFIELIPSAKKYGNKYISILGFILGMIVMASSLILFETIL